MSRNAARTLRRSRRKSENRRSRRKSRTMSISALRAALLDRVIAAIGRRVGVDVLGGHRRPDEDEPVVEIRAVQDLARHRVEERFRAFRLLVVDEQADEVELGALPQRVGAGPVQPGGAEFAPDARGGLLARAGRRNRCGRRPHGGSPASWPFRNDAWRRARNRGTARSGDRNRRAARPRLRARCLRRRLEPLRDARWRALESPDHLGAGPCSASRCSSCSTFKLAL